MKLVTFVTPGINTTLTQKSMVKERSNMDTTQKKW